MLVIVDNKLGNIGSIANMLTYLGIESVITSDPGEVARATKIILPGVGSFDSGMRNLQELDLIAPLNHKVLMEKVPTLGICLGMQMMSHGSEEGQLPGLGWIDAVTVKFNIAQNDHRLRLPHMGWNNVIPQNDIQRLFPNEADLRFYFVHSYHVICRHTQEVLSSTHYGYQFTSAIQKNNIVGVQFHPEKSHKYGMTFLKNFCESR